MFINTSPISPLTEIVAYESIWADQKTNFKKLAEMFAKYPGSRPSDFIESQKVEYLDEIRNIILDVKRENQMGLLISGTFDFPTRLKDAKEPVELLYYCGNLEYLNTRSVAIVGTRKPSQRGLDVTEAITRSLVLDGFTIVSGLAQGIDTQAHKTAIMEKGRTIAVIGTPLNKVYPSQNKGLQEIISKNHLLISQVPFYRYSKQDYRINRLFFIERNKTMSALTEATIIVEAGETSGSLTQAEAAIHQRRKLIILDDCFHNKSITWPDKFLKKGAIRVKSYSDIKKALGVEQ